MNITIEHNIPELLAWIDAAPDMALDELKTGVEEAQVLFHRLVRDATPSSGSEVSGQGGAHSLRASITAHLPQVIPGGVIGIVGTSKEYALPVELGTRPHFPPIAPIELWVQTKLGLEGKEAKSVAIAIVKTIGKRGTKGAKMFQNTFNATEEQLKQILTQAVQRIADRMNGK